MAAPGVVHSMLPLLQENSFKFTSQSFLAELLDNSILKTNSLVLAFHMERLYKSLVLQTGVSLSASGYNTVIIRSCPMPELPPHVCGMPRPESKTVCHLQFLYIPTVSLLVDYLLSLVNTNRNLPEALLLEDMDFYTKQMNESSDMAIAKLCNVLMDTVKFLTTCHAQKVPLLITTADTLEHHLNIYKQHIYTVATLHNLTSEGDVDKIELKELSGPVTFTLTLQSDEISLEKIELCSTPK